MSDDEFLLNVIDSIISQMKEERSEIVRDDFSEIAEEYDDYIEILESIRPEIDGIDSLFDLEDDEFSILAECLEDYAENFIVDGRSEEALKKSEAEYQRLTDILFDLFDDEEFDEDEVLQDEQ